MGCHRTDAASVWQPCVRAPPVWRSAAAADCGLPATVALPSASPPWHCPAVAGMYRTYRMDGPLRYTPLLSRCAVHIPSCMYAATPCSHTQLAMACPSPSRCAARAVAPRHRCYFGNLQGYRLAAALDLPRIELPAKARTVASGLGRVTGGRGGGVEVWWRTQLQRPAVAVPVRCNGTPAASPLLPSPVPHPTAPRRRPLVGDIGWPRRVHAFDLATPVGAPLRTVPLGLVHHGWYGACIIILQSFRAGGCRCRPRHAPARPAAPNGQTAMRFPRYHGTFLPPRQSRPAPPPPSPPFLV